jgi:hypothetical protein
VKSEKPFPILEMPAEALTQSRWPCSITAAIEIYTKPEMIDAFGLNSRGYGVVGSVSL